MKITKEVVFLGYKDMILKDGTVLLTVSMYVDNTAMEVNVLASNIPVASAVKSLSFGDSCTVTFALRKVDKLYKLGLESIA